MTLDAIDAILLTALAEDARAPLKVLAARAGLSSPSAAERIRKLQDRGIIRGFTAVIDWAALGYSLEAIVRIRPLPGQLHSVRKLIEDTPEISTCDKVTGEDCFVARLHARSMAEIDQVLDEISERATTNTSIVKSKIVIDRPPPLTPRT